ncbi:MAG: hypothetical protein U1E10_16240 [Bdellovibrionales bacterium]|jgi:hypothetical protein|nr:hypothetical protein [Bdellovibrionales bacterium]
MQNSSEGSNQGAAQKLMELLDEKNQYLERFFELNESELLNFADGYFDNVESFYQAREKILDIVRCIDALVDDEVALISDDGVSQSMRAEMKDLMAQKDKLAKQILAQDLQVLAAIETEKSNIIRELKSTGQNRKAVAAYRSGPAGHQLDEEV